MKSHNDGWIIDVSPRFPPGEPWVFHKGRWSEERLNWVKTNCNGKFDFDHATLYFWFEQEEDALAFKIRWAE